ncbi:MAG TPA: M28 family metallopeptidase [Gemmatimonadales bacterium]|jgi:carboxypeptidase Q|nr:M28 family metallopeptidase [Gemmatimonadales bacterium]
MRRLWCFGCLLALPSLTRAQAKPAEPASSIQREYQAIADRIIAAATADSSAWNKLAELTDGFGHRISGSEALERAIDWMIERMKAEGLAKVRGEPAMVPKWVRGEERAELVQPRHAKLPMLGLGGSVATPKGGIEAEVLVVSSFDELKARAALAKGKIVLFDAPFTNYGQTVAYRYSGALESARVGALATLIRSVGPFGMRTPHTGTMAPYDSTLPKLPAAAITMEDAAMLHRMQARGQKIVVRLEMAAQTLPDVPSRNVMGELVGREKPDEVVVFGGHIDSWDVGTGAMDDAGGVVIAWEAIRLLTKLGLKPRRTIRAVGWTNEENGGRGGTAYREAHRDELAKHIAAIESDGGTFKFRGFGFSGGDSAYAIVKQIGKLLKPLGADTVFAGGGGSDIGPIMALGVPGMSHNVDGSRYFWYHHTEADNVDKINPKELAENVAAMAVMAYVLADLPTALPRGGKPVGR